MNEDDIGTDKMRGLIHDVFKKLPKNAQWTHINISCNSQGRGYTCFGYIIHVDIEYML